MTVRAEAEVQIARGIDAVWPELAALERFPEWLRESGISRVERAPGEPLGAGAGLRIEQRLAGRVSVLEGVVTVWDPPHRLGFQARHPDGITIEAEAVLAPDGSTTWVRWRLAITLPLRLRLFESMAAPEVRRAAAADLFGFKRRLEQVAT
ncbi:MAG TPA: SRPBCC family protein [Vitreimonas sp.]|nr:SRPBCC family protein [Vitreimonas sp.]